MPSMSHLYHIFSVEKNYPKSSLPYYNLADFFDQLVEDELQKIHQPYWNPRIIKNFI